MLSIFDAFNAWLATPMLIDWMLLGAQVVYLASVIIREAARPHDRNLYALLIAGTLLVMVQGQDWWMLSRLHNAAYLVHLNQVVTRDGVRLANGYLALAMACFALSRWTARRLSRSRRGPESTHRDGLVQPAAIRVPYLFVAAVTAVGAAVTIVLAGGLKQALSTPGQLIAGASVFLVLAGIGKVPALALLSRGTRPTLLAVTLLLAAVAVTLLNSRFLTLFILIQVVVTAHYCRRPVRRRSLGIFGLAAVLVMLGFGLYRDYGVVSAGDPSQASASSFLDKRVSSGVIDWFYSLNVEDFAGFAGILTYESRSPTGIVHDYGISTLGFIPHLLPNAVRNDPALPFNGVTKFIDGAYPYKGSVVPGGFEMVYAGFGFVGVLLFGSVLGYASIGMDSAVRRRQAAGDALVYCVVSVAVLQMIRGTFASSIFFALADVSIVYIYRWVAGMKRTRAPSLGPMPRVAEVN